MRLLGSLVFCLKYLYRLVLFIWLFHDIINLSIEGVDGYEDSSFYFGL